MLMVMGIGSFTYAQKVKEKDIIGTWKLIIDVKEELDQEAEEADTMLEEVFVKAISGFVGGILEDIDIYLDFKKDNTVYITVKAYDEEDTGSGNWFINDKGYLEIESIESDNGDIDIDAEDDEWMLVDGLLISDDDDDTKNVYMTKVD